MNDLICTADARIKALERLGYTPREAQFLCLAALHGGYFLRRQYVQFTDKAVGGTAATLIEKALAKGHARSTTYAARTNIYHLCSRPFYAAIGQQNNRNRRVHQPAAIRVKLMALDFVLAHSQAQYLTTEREKLDYFTDAVGLDVALLPSAQYVVRDRKTERYFVEKFPIFLEEGSTPEAAKVAVFCFIDGDAAGLSGFETFLRKYQPLFAALADFRLIYVAANDSHFDGAASAFARRFGLQKNAAENHSEEHLIAPLLAYFEMRQWREAGKWDAFDRAKLTQLREDSERFKAARFDALYHRYVTEGEIAVRAALMPRPSVGMPSRGAFSTCLLEENYELFGMAAA